MRQSARRSKIVCTLGPSVNSYEAICQLIDCGMDVARLNFSHGSHEGHKQVIDWIRAASKSMGVPVAILGDLQGPKIRTGMFLDPKQSSLELKKNEILWFRGLEHSQMKPGNGTRESPICISFPRLVLDLKVGDPVLVEDGLIRFVVVEKDVGSNLVGLELVHGKSLGTKKGVNMPASKLSALGLTEKDWEDVLFAVQENVDFVALSFVRTAREIKSLRGFLEQKKSGIHVLAKIEKQEALENIDEILDQAHGIMVARGDLGVEIGNENVPIVQKQLIEKSRRKGKPVITATQMLMSMIENPSPSRAEASDVANAVLDGSDALMLSNETAAGKYPMESVLTMSKIIESAETISAQDYQKIYYEKQGSVLPVSEAIEAAATGLAKNLNAKCLACLTRSGQAARLLAKSRPRMPIYAFTENEKVRNQLCLSWGISSVPWKEVRLQDYTIFDDMLQELGRLGLIFNQELAVMTAGIPTTLQVGTTNTVIVRKFERKD